VNQRDYLAPALIIAFNSGIHEAAEIPLTDSWRPTLMHILKMQAPVVFTSYNMEEANKDNRTISELRSELSFESKTKSRHDINPFRGMRPFLDCDNFIPFHQNGFITIHTMGFLE